MFACQQWVAGRAAGSWWLMPAAHSTACLLLCEACCSLAAHFPPANPLSCPPRLITLAPGACSRGPTTVASLAWSCPRTWVRGSGRGLAAVTALYCRCCFAGLVWGAGSWLAAVWWLGRRIWVGPSGARNALPCCCTDTRQPSPASSRLSGRGQQGDGDQHDAAGAAGAALVRCVLRDRPQAHVLPVCFLLQLWHSCCFFRECQWQHHCQQLMVCMASCPLQRS